MAFTVEKWCLSREAQCWAAQQCDVPGSSCTLLGMLKAATIRWLQGAPRCRWQSLSSLLHPMGWNQLLSNPCCFTTWASQVEHAAVYERQTRSVLKVLGWRSLAG